ncbi:heat shock protein Hsp20 [Cyclobacterium xiamenense]|uniref:Heat shock protein Hsp20 n=1 Tax=Cyclobacterium xiamenense TaxID=1297121 RepID=A0A1H6TJT5_9BACT|nr:Hsp20/alpha crystallin family protein [Cyclobacterium xiamenense]SEI77417.1 heat shock protein Hsp20 [Cyclobacterium xiamenense]
MEQVISKNGWKPTTGLFDDLVAGDWIQTNRRRGNTAFVPMVNILESNEAYRIEMGLPGTNREEIKVELDQQVLSISGSAKQNAANEQVHYLTKEFNYHSFSRSFQLPETIDTEQIDARFDNGLLALTLPKREEARRKPIKIIDISE